MGCLYRQVVYVCTCERESVCTCTCTVLYRHILHEPSVPPGSVCVYMCVCVCAHGVMYMYSIIQTYIQCTYAHIHSFCMCVCVCISTHTHKDGHTHACHAAILNQRCEIRHNTLRNQSLNTQKFASKKAYSAPILSLYPTII
jgi:hypothetical protein